MSNNVNYRSSIVDHNKRIRIMFLRDEKKQPTGSIAIEFLKGEQSGTIVYQVAALSPKDRFVRDVSRQLVKGRLIEKPVYVYGVQNDLSINKITEVVMTDIVRHGEASNFPPRAIQSAKLWLRSSPPNRVETNNQSHTGLPNGGVIGVRNPDLISSIPDVGGRLG